MANDTENNKRFFDYFIAVSVAFSDGTIGVQTLFCSFNREIISDLDIKNLDLLLEKEGVAGGLLVSPCLARPTKCQVISFQRIDILTKPKNTIIH